MAHRLETKVMEIIGEDPDSPDVFTDSNIAFIRDSVNDAIQELAVVTGGLKREYFIPLRKGQAFYRFKLETGFMGWVTDVWDEDREMRLQRTSVISLANHDPKWMSHDGPPDAYMQLGDDVIGFYRKPTANSNIMRVTIVEIPEPYTQDTDRTKLRDTFEYGVIAYAVGEYWAERGVVDEALAQGRLYIDSLGIKDRHLQSSEAIKRLRTQKAPFPEVVE